ncbi:MAG: hypothetical protein ABI778_05190, partial [Ignavibacteriota bacterium]
MYSQEKESWRVEAAVGGVRGLNEAITQSMNPGIWIDAIWLDGIAPHLSAQAGFGVTSNSSPDLGHYSEYFTDLISLDIRLQYSPFTEGSIQPYIYGGIGLLFFSVTSSPPNASLDKSTSGAALYLPVGIGVGIPVGHDFGVDLKIGENPAFTDDLNPVHDQRNDAFWGFSLGLTYSFGNGVNEDID